MNTILHTPATGASIYHPGGLRDGAALAEIGEIFPGVWNLLEVILPVPEHDPATQIACQLAGVPDFDSAHWVVGWAVQWIHQPPLTLTPRQLRLGLLSLGISPATIAARLAGNEAAQIEWEYAQEIRRDHPLVTSLAATLGMDATALQDFYRTASNL
jgi:hypothetical protein